MDFSNKNNKSILSIVIIAIIVFLIGGFALTQFDIIDNPFGSKTVALSQKELTLQRGSSFQLKSDQSNVIYESSNPDIVKVNEITGYLEGLRVGKATITVYLKNNQEVKDTCIVTVYSNDKKPNVPVTTKTTIETTSKTIYVTGIKVNNSNININVGESKTISYTITPSNATNKVITFTSSNNKVATVNGSGTVKGVGEGTATITLKSKNGKTATCKVTVSKKVTTTQPVTVKYTLTYNPNGGSVSPTSKTLNEGSTYGSLPTPTRSGYTFKGWYTSIDGGNKVATTTKINGNTTIYAHWSKNSTTTTTSKPSRIHFMNTGSSDAIIIESNGHYGLVDSSNPYNDGTAYSVSNSTQSVQHVVNYLNSLGVKYLDFVIGTHSHSDHIGGMRVIASKFVNSKTKYYYRKYTGTLEDSTTNWDNGGYYNRAVNAMKNAGATLVEVTNQKPTITLGDFSIKLMNTETARSSEMSGGKVARENSNSIVQYITYKGKYKTLLAADMETSDEMDVANAIGSIEVLKVGHHSYNTSSSGNFIAKLSPKVAIITNSSAESTFNAVGSQIQSLGGKVYITGKTSDAVIVEYKDSTYTVSPSGAKQTFSGTAQSSGEWKYVDGKGWMLLKDGKYLYNSWYQDSKGIWYYLNGNGVCVTDWQELTWNGSKKWYYFNSDCEMISNKCLTIKGEKFCFNSSGECTSGRGC